ncbi:MAG: RNA polymerase sigma factor [Nitrospiraceae bacterium]
MHDRALQSRHPGGREDVTGSMEQALTDAEIVRLVVEGKTDVFETLVARHRAQVFKIVGGHVPRAQVEEVAHEVFVRAFTSLATFSDHAPFPHWLSTLAVRTCYGYWRGAYRSRETPMSALSEEGLQWVARVESAQADRSFRERETAQEARAVLQWALDQLSPENRMVLTLVYLEGKSVREASALLGWSQINVKVRAHRARKRMRTLLLGLVEERGNP